MSIYKGSTNISKVYKGSTEVDSLCLGTTNIWTNVISVGDKPDTAPVAAYTGSAISNGYTAPTGVTVTGSTSGTNGGTYTATYTPDAGYCWADKTTDTVTVVLTIQYVWTKWNSVAGTSYYDSTSWLDYNTREDAKGVTYTYFTSGPTISNGVWSGSTASATLQEWVGYKVRISSTQYLQVTQNTLMSFYPMTFADGGTLHTIKSSTTYSKGSTSYGNVTSTSNTYPANGRHSDGYWYVKGW